MVILFSNSFFSEQCPPGTHARKKAIRNSRKIYKQLIERPTLQPFCKSCPIGTYQDGYGKLQCIPCPKGYTTLAYGMTDVAYCIETAEEVCMKSRTICNSGTCVARDRIHYECDCSAGYIGEKRINLLMELIFYIYLLSEFLQVFFLCSGFLKKC